MLSSGFWTSAIPKGFSTSIRMLASGEQPGLLMPGETIRVPVYYAGWLKPWDFRYPPFEFKVVALTSDDQRQVPWSLLQPTLKPAEVDDDAWAAIWENATSAIGSTVGDFVSMLSRNAVYLSKIGSEARDINALLSFEILKASGGVVSFDGSGVQRRFGHQFGRDQFCGSRDPSRGISPIAIDWVLWATDGAIRGISAWRRWTMAQLQLSQEMAPKASISLTVESEIAISRARATGPRWSALGILSHSPEEMEANRYSIPADIFVRSEDRNGNSISLQYENNQLSSLTHSNGRSIELRYNASGLVSEVEDSLGRVVAYSYDAGSHLVSYTDSSGRITEYDYSASQRPTKAACPHGDQASRRPG